MWHKISFDDDNDDFDDDDDGGNFDDGDCDDVWYFREEGKCCVYLFQDYYRHHVTRCLISIDVHSGAVNDAVSTDCSDNDDADDVTFHTTKCLGFNDVLKQV